jgi:hypothetical protein
VGLKALHDVQISLELVGLLGKVIGYPRSSWEDPGSSWSMVEAHGVFGHIGKASRFFWTKSDDWPPFPRPLIPSFSR